MKRFTFCLALFIFFTVGMFPQGTTFTPGIIPSQSYKNIDSPHKQDITHALLKKSNLNNILKIGIINSRDINEGHCMDTVWAAAADSMGFPKQIISADSLMQASSLAGFDVIIVASGVMEMIPAHINSLLQFIRNGKSVYIQSEYTPTLSTNIAFKNLVDSLGGSFTWGNTISGDLNPVSILGTFATTPYNTNLINFFFYGVAGTGDTTIIPFLRKDNNNIGFLFTPPNRTCGEVITQTDQDWINQRKNIPLMANILYSFQARAAFVPVELTSFTANMTNGNVNLNWVTATEINNRGFEIEKYTDNKWQKIGFVAGFGTTTYSQNYQFTDNGIKGNVLYRLKQIDFDGKFKYSNEVTVTSVESPKGYSLVQNYPNPFNPSTTIKYSVPEQSNIKISIYNQLGQQVAAVVNGVKDAGNYEQSFNASNLSSGVYFYKIEAASLQNPSNTFISTKKMLLMK
ncbi:MAG: T9SS type A sorting domain-containing protein [Bacteroidota bacterium]|nr:T9SS type A sorting domain-containing protein [Bacteroidota bacterium]